jgi:hypothetical protein
VLLYSGRTAVSEIAQAAVRRLDLPADREKRAHQACVRAVAPGRRHWGFRALPGTR